MALSLDHLLYCLRVELEMSIADALVHSNGPGGGLYADLGADLAQAPNAGEAIGISRHRLTGTLLGVAIGIRVAALAGTSVWSVGIARLLSIASWAPWPTCRSSPRRSTARLAMRWCALPEIGRTTGRPAFLAAGKVHGGARIRFLFSLRWYSIPAYGTPRDKRARNQPR